MGCTGNNATPPSPAIATGRESLDPRRYAERLVERFGPGGADPRLAELVPGFDAPFFQAGLAGYSDAAMRIIARDMGAPLCVTEALLDRTLLAGGRGFAKADLGELEDNVPGGEGDHPLVCQIMGSDPAEMAASAIKAIEQASRKPIEYRAMAAGESGAPLTARDEGDRGFAVIDVNLACPVKKVKAKARGGHWLAEPDGAVAILEAVRGAVPARIPVTVKMRRAFDETDEMRERFLRVFDAAYQIGCAWVTVHGRTVKQQYLGPSRWDPIRDLCRRWPERLIFGSGDVWEAADIFRMMEHSGVAAVSVARGAIGNPWIFRQARQMLAGVAPTEPTIAEQRAVLERHFDLAIGVNARTRKPEALTARQMRKFGVRFSAHHPMPDVVKPAFTRVRSLGEWRAVLDEHYVAAVERSATPALA